MKLIDILNKIANENEYWQQLDDYGTYNTYFISTQGRICNQKGKILKQQIDKSGYPRIMLRDRNGKRNKMEICNNSLYFDDYLNGY